MRLPQLIAVVMLMAAGVPAAAAHRAPVQPDGLWLNPHSSVAVRAGPCGANLCGWIIWANQEAQADARDGGIAKLVGIELLQDYHSDGGSTWAGTVFVPDMGRHFASKIALVGPDRLKVQGCILGGLICKSQVWTRIEHPPGG